jgi:hypothetical protein
VIQRGMIVIAKVTPEPDQRAGIFRHGARVSL